VTDQARMEYIDSQLAKQRASQSSTTTTTNTHAFGTIPSASTTQPLFHSLPANITSSTLPKTQQQDLNLNRQPATLGKLQEVDLGSLTKWRNEEQTRRKIAGEKSLEEEELEAAKAAKAPKKVRLGPDGKPWRGRRKRRGSEDVERDRIVEEVLRENRCKSYLLYPFPFPDVILPLSTVSIVYPDNKTVEIYDSPSHQTPEVEEADGAADDRIAEAFKQEFMDAQAQRRQKNIGPPSGLPARTAAGKKEEEALKGPKLGGSRNARQAMRDMMLKGSGVKK
jgi:hypothetical protein